MNGDDESSHVSSSITRSVLQGATIQFEAEAAEGYLFIGWDGAITGTENPVSAQFEGCSTVTAQFAPAPVVTMVVSGSGSITPKVGRHTYAEGSVVELTATPDEHWQFDGWSGGVNAPALPTTTLTVNDDETVTANFSRIMHTLTLKSTRGGRNLTTVAVYSYPEGTTVGVTATIESGWRFNGWSGDVADITSETTSVTMDSDETVTADFARTRPDSGQIGIMAGAISSGLGAFFITRRRRAPAKSDNGASPPNVNG